MSGVLRGKSGCPACDGTGWRDSMMESPVFCSVIEPLHEKEKYFQK